MSNVFPQARCDNLTLQAFDNELVLLDATTNKAQLLNATAAFVWQHCDGKTTVPEIARQLAQAHHTAPDEAAVWYALKLLSDQQLLTARVVMPKTYKKMSRRDFLLAGMIGTAILVPVVITLITPTATNASTCLEQGLACIGDQDCCSNSCPAGTCA